MQLKFCDDPYGITGLPYRSFLRVDVVHEVSLEILEPQISYGRHLELRQDSYRRLLNFMGQRMVR